MQLELLDLYLHLKLTGLKWMKGKSSWLVPAPPEKTELADNEGSGQQQMPIKSSLMYYTLPDEVPTNLQHRVR